LHSAAEASKVRELALQAAAPVSADIANLLDETDPLESHYEVTQMVLGDGKTGWVRLALHKDTRERVAVKTFVLGLDLMDMCREMVIHSDLSHPRIVEVKGCFVGKGHGHLVTECLEGGDLIGHILEKQVLGEEHVKLVIKQVLQAVAYLHARGIAHRDIKPENIMYRSASRDKVKLIDLGLCCQWTRGSAPMERYCGTRPYMAPEVLEGSYTNMADMWSLGVTIHVMLTGQLPGQHADSTLRLSNLLRECSTDAQQFLQALLTLDPAKRMSAFYAQRHSWLRGLRLPAAVPVSGFPADASPMRLTVSLGAPAVALPSEDVSAENFDTNSSLEPPHLASSKAKKEAWTRTPGRLMRLMWSSIRRTKAAAKRVQPEMQIVPSHSAGRPK
jgi:serine/threonine protein kinase